MIADRIVVGTDHLIGLIEGTMIVVDTTIPDMIVEMEGIDTIGDGTTGTDVDPGPGVLIEAMIVRVVIDTESSHRFTCQNSGDLMRHKGNI